MAGYAQTFGGPSQPPVCCDQVGSQPFSQGHVGRVIGREDVPKVEAAMEELLMSVSGEGQVQVVLEGFLGPTYGPALPAKTTPNC